MSTVRILQFFTICWFSGALSAAYGFEAKVTEHIRASSVYIERSDGGTATGFFLGGHGYVVTAAHVVEGSTDPLTVQIRPLQATDGAEAVEGVLVALDRDKDLAILKTDLSPSSFLSMASQVPVHLDELLVCGFPFGAALGDAERSIPEPSLNLCRVSAIRKLDNGTTVLQLDNQLNPGNSGGVVANAAGEVVGVVSSGIPGSGINFATALPEIRTFLNAPTAIRTIHQPATAELLDDGLQFRADLFFLREMEGDLEVSLTLQPDNQIAQTVRLNQAAKGTYIGKANPISLEHGEATVLSARVHFRNGAIRTVRLQNLSPIQGSSKNRFSELEALTFDEKRNATMVYRKGNHRSIDAADAWSQIIAAQIEPSPALEVDASAIERIGFARALPMREVVATIRVAHGGAELGTKHFRMKIEHSEAPTTREIWLGLKVTSANRAQLWGPDIPEITRAETTQSAQTEAARRLAAGDAPIHVRFVEGTRDTTPDKLRIELPDGCATTPTPFLGGRRLLLPLQYTRNFAIFDLAEGRFTAFLHVDAEAVVFAGLGEKLYALVDGEALYTLDAASLHIDGAVALRTGFDANALWGGLGHGKYLTLTGREQTSVYIYDTEKQNGQLVECPHNADDHQFHSMENGDILIADAHGVFRTYLKSNGSRGHEVANREWPVPSRPLPLDWSGHRFLFKSGQVYDVRRSMADDADEKERLHSTFNWSTQALALSETSGRSLELVDLRSTSMAFTTTRLELQNMSVWTLVGLHLSGARVHLLHNSEGTNTTPQWVLETFDNPFPRK